MRRRLVEAYGLAKVVLLLWVPPFGGVFALLLADERKVGVVSELRVLGCADGRGGKLADSGRCGSGAQSGARGASYGLS